jgi:hypothetical protein
MLNMSGQEVKIACRPREVRAPSRDRQARDHCLGYLMILTVGRGVLYVPLGVLELLTTARRIVMLLPQGSTEYVLP